jgi:hypothetical protein
LEDCFDAFDDFLVLGYFEVLVVKEKSLFAVLDSNCDDAVKGWEVD